MGSTTIRISEPTRDALRDLASTTGESMQALLEKAIEEYRQRRFWEEVNAAYSKLRDNPEEWAAELEERRISEQTLADGLDDE